MPQGGAEIIHLDTSTASFEVCKPEVSSSSLAPLVPYAETGASPARQVKAEFVPRRVIKRPSGTGFDTPEGMAASRSLRSKEPSRSHMSRADASAIDDDELGKMFHIPGLKRYKPSTSVQVPTYFGTLKPKPTGETAEAIKEEEALGILSRALHFMTDSMQARCLEFSLEEARAQASCG